MATESKAAYRKNSEKPQEKRLTKPSREVQRLLKIAGLDQPEISDLENLGSRKTRGVRARTRSNSAEQPDIIKADQSAKSRLSAESLSLEGFLEDESENEGSQRKRNMGKSAKRRRSQREEETYKIRCICGARKEGHDTTEAWIQCDECQYWQHNVCMGISIVSSEMPEKYKCQDCDPVAHQELLDGMDRGERPWEQRREKYEVLEEEMGSDKKRKVTGEDGISSQVRQDEHMLGSLGVESPEVESESKQFPLTEECVHYEHKSEVPWDIQKYFSQRYSIFTKYDEGIYMTDDSWFGVTPEPVAIQISDDLTIQTSPAKRILIDLFAGAGGNSIAFALSDRWDKIIAIEKDPSVIACAQHNAAIYGVSEKITWINADCFDYLSTHASSVDISQTVIFASPPWGGTNYRDHEIFDLSTMQPYSIKNIHDACRNMDSALFLPRTSDLRQIASLTPAGKKVEIVQYCMVGASKGLVAYIPASSD